VVWGSDWPHLAHQSAGTGADAPPAAYRPVNERALLRFLREWAGDDRTWRRILVENPQRLYEF
jgi:predicted TIM-barrel fold metal-dependent hydrolase